MRSDTIYHLLKRIARKEYVDEEIKEDGNIKPPFGSILTAEYHQSKTIWQQKKNWVKNNKERHIRMIEKFKRLILNNKFRESTPI